MKKIILSILISMTAIVANGQTTLETVSVKISDDCYYPVIVPTLNNLLAIVNMDVNTFKSMMAKYHYHPDENLSGSSYIYTNSSLDFYLYNSNGLGINTIMFDPVAGNNKFAGFWVFSKQAYPRTCIQDLYQQLAPYYQKTVGIKRYYALKYNGYAYGIEMQPSQDRTNTAVHIYKFGR